MRVISRRTETGIEVFDEDLESSRVFPAPDDQPVWAVPATRDAVVLETAGSVVRIGPDGRRQWCAELGLRTPVNHRFMIDVRFSADDSQVWVYVPAAFTGREEHDDWIVLDAATGAVRSRRRLRGTGQGGDQFPLRDGRMLLSLVSAAGAPRILLAGPDGEPHDYGWGDRTLIAVSPDERQFLTMEFAGFDVTFHTLPGGESQARVPIEAFGDLLGPDIDLDEVFVEWAGGYLDDETALVVISGEHSVEGEWWRHFRVSARTGEVLDELRVATIDADDLQPLGDGTYVITDTDGTLRRM
jgi:hypothetical protein